MRMGQTHMMRYMAPLLDRVDARRDRPVVRHHASPAPRRRARAYRMFRDKRDECIKVVMKP